MKPLTLSSVGLGLVVLLGLLAITPSSPSEAAGGPCGLPQAAFCDTFGNAFQGGRAGQLDPTRWSVTRLTSDLNASQGILNQWYPTTLPICDQNVGKILADNDVRICSPESYFDELFQDGGNFAYMAFRPRHPSRTR